LRSIEELGGWLKVYGEAIYGTRPHAPYRTDNFAFTTKNGKVYAFYLYKDENESLINEIEIPVNLKAKSVALLGSELPVSFINTNKGVKVSLPVREGKAPVCDVFVLD
jgi:alpha-L-fucosidase